MDVGTSEDGAFWLAFLRSLTARGLSGVELVTSDAHQGLKNAIAAVFAGGRGSARNRARARLNWFSQGQPWGRCRVRRRAERVSRLHGHLDPSAQARPTWRGHHGPHHLPATVSRRGPRPIGSSGGTTPGALSPGGRTAGGRRAGHPGLHGLPSGPLAEAVVQQPAGTAEPGDKAPSRACPRKGTWWASAAPPTGDRRGAWWARCWPSSSTDGPKPAATSPSPTPPATRHCRRPICWTQRPDQHQKG